MWIRLKLIAPFHRPREPRPRDSCSPPSPFDFFFLAMAALHVDEGGLARHRRTPDFLFHGRAPLPMREREFFPRAALDGAMDRLDDRDVDETFPAGRLGRAPLAHGLREMDELRRELVA